MPEVVFGKMQHVLIEERAIAERIWHPKNHASTIGTHPGDFTKQFARIGQMLDAVRREDIREPIIRKWQCSVDVGNYINAFCPFLVDSDVCAAHNQCQAVGIFWICRSYGIILMRDNFLSVWCRRLVTGKHFVQNAC